MKALVIKPHNYPEMWELPDLKAMQECVGGHIQAIYPWPDVPAALVCDEDGLAHDNEWNRYICEGVAIKGTFFICGLGEDDFTDLPNDLADRFRSEFHDPDVFIGTPHGVVVMDKNGVRAVI